MGMVGARELLPGEAPALAPAVERARRRGRAWSAAALRARRRLPAGALGRAGARAAAPALAVSTGLLGVATPAELEGIVAHELAHICAAATCSPRRSWSIVAAALIESSRIGGYVPAGAPRSSSGRSPRRSCTCCSRRSGSSRPTASPPSSASRRTASRTGCSGSSRRWSSSQFQASPATEPLYTANPFAEEGLAALFVTHPPLGERVRRLRDARPGVAREAARGLSTTEEPGPSRGPSTER